MYVQLWLVIGVVTDCPAARYTTTLARKMIVTSKYDVHIRVHTGIIFRATVITSHICLRADCLEALTLPASLLTRSGRQLALGAHPEAGCEGHDASTDRNLGRP